MADERLALLAHELRSPVAALTALAERADLSLDAELLLRMMRLALAAGRDVERLLGDPDAISVRLSETSLVELLQGLDRPGVVVASEPARVVADPTRLRQAIANVVENGLRHGTTVRVAARADASGVVVEIADDGPGLPPGLDPFERGASRDGSTGYGLWLARAIARAHGGELTVESCPGRGATFRLVLPPASGASGRGPAAT